MVRALLSVVLIAGAVTMPTYAQGVELSLGGGVSLPLGEFGNTANTGWHGLVGISYTWEPLGVRVDGALNRFAFDTEGAPDLDIQTQVLHGTANAVYAFGQSGQAGLRPYLIGGVGAYQTKQTGDDADPSDSADFGVNGGAGVGLKTDAVGGFVEGRYHNIIMTGTDTNRAFIAFTIGVRLGGS